MGGFRLGLEFDKLTYSAGERLECRGVLQNVSERELMVNKGTIHSDWTVVILRGKEQLPVNLDRGDWTISFGAGPITLKPGAVDSVSLRLDTHFDLSRAGSYLIYLKRRIPRGAPIEKNIPFDGPGGITNFSFKTVDSLAEVISDNVVINIVTAAPGAPNEPAKNAAPSAPGTSNPAMNKSRPNQPAIPEADLVGSPSKTATPGAREPITSENPAAAASAAKSGVESTASGLPSGSTGVSRTLGLALAFALLALAALWWLFRGK